MLRKCARATKVAHKLLLLNSNQRGAIVTQRRKFTNDNKPPAHEEAEVEQTTSVAPEEKVVPVDVEGKKVYQRKQVDAAPSKKR